MNTTTDAAALEVPGFQWPLSLSGMLVDLMLAGFAFAELRGQAPQAIADVLSCWPGAWAWLNSLCSWWYA